jgi:hypothetical protein
MALHRRTTQQQIHLIIIVPKPSQILNDPQRRLPIRHRRIHVVLPPILIDAEPFKREVATGAELGLHGPLVEDGGFHAEVRHPVFHHGELQRDDAGHFDGAAEGDFAVAFYFGGRGRRLVDVSNGNEGRGVCVEREWVRK